MKAIADTMGVALPSCGTDEAENKICPQSSMPTHHAPEWTAARATYGQTTTTDSRRQVGYAVSLKKRKRAEEVFGWAKTVGGLRKARFIVHSG